MLTQLYQQWSGAAPDSLEALPISGSARKYFRISGCAGTAIGCIGTSRAENRAFFAISERFCAAGLHAPQIYAISPDQMCYLQEDLGDGQLFALLQPQIADSSFSEQQRAWIHDSICLLPAVQFKVAQDLDWSVCYPEGEFNSRMVSFDLNYFKYSFLKLTGLEFNEIRLQDEFDLLCRDSLRFEGDTFLYRDFQARNIIIKDGEPCFIDFQGGRRGPVQYDLASFLWNAGTHFPASMRTELEQAYLNALANFTPVDESSFYRRYRLLTLIRLLQETAAYGFRGIVERKQLFLNCIPAAVKSLGELVAQPFDRYPYLSDLLARLSSEWKGGTILPDVAIPL